MLTICLEATEKARMEAIGECIKLLQLYIDIYMSDSPQCEICGLSCNAMVLESLIKGLSAAGVYPLPKRPYNGISYANLSKVLQSITFPSMCESMAKMGLRSMSQLKACDITKELHEGVRKARLQLKRLQLK